MTRSIGQSFIYTINIQIVDLLHACCLSLHFSATMSCLQNFVLSNFNNLWSLEPMPTPCVFARSSYWTPHIVMSSISDWLALGYETFYDSNIRKDSLMDTSLKGSGAVMIHLLSFHYINCQKNAKNRAQALNWSLPWQCKCPDGTWTPARLSTWSYQCTDHV